VLKFLASWLGRVARIEFHFHAPVTLNVLQASRKSIACASPRVIDVNPQAQRQRMTIALAPGRRERMLAAPSNPRTRASWKETVKALSNGNRF
jgi:hypothetical protein